MNRQTLKSLLLAICDEEDKKLRIRMCIEVLDEINWESHMPNPVISIEGKTYTLDIDMGRSGIIHDIGVIIT